MSSSFEDQFKDVTSLITLFEQCLQDTQHFIDDMAQCLHESVKSDVITEAERHRLLSYSAKKSTLLVVGQTNSGKSSFVNELLGGSYMPTSELPCTSRIIRLKYSDKNYYQVHIYIRIAEATLPAILFFLHVFLHPIQVGNFLLPSTRERASEAAFITSKALIIPPPKSPRIMYPSFQSSRPNMIDTRTEYNVITTSYC